MKNVELTNRRSDKQTDDSDIIGPSVYGDQYRKKTWPYLSFEYISDV